MNFLRYWHHERSHPRQSDYGHFRSLDVMKICETCGRRNPDDCTWCPECGTVPRSERIKRALLMPFAIEPIMKCGAIPGIVGVVVLAVGLFQKIRWLEIVGAVLAAPIFWFFLSLFLYFCRGCYSTGFAEAKAERDGIQNGAGRRRGVLAAISQLTESASGGITCVST